MIPTYSIITVNANDKVGQLHDRMPAILRPGDYEEWLQANRQDPEGLLRLLQPTANEEVSYYPVSADLNRTRRNYVNETYLIEPLESQ